VSDARGGGALTREQVIALGRPAWVSLDGAGETVYHFDGSHFWLRKVGYREPIPSFAVPLNGWAHEDDCACAVCRALDESGV